MLRQPRPKRSFTPPGGEDRVKSRGYEDLTPYEIDDADYEEVRPDRED